MNEAAERMRKMRQQRRSMGLCIRCGSELSDSHSSCQNCRDKYNRRSMARLKNHCVRNLRIWKITNQLLFDRLDSTGMTIREFAYEVGVSARTVERWLFEGTIPSYPNIAKINDFFGEEIYYIEEDV